MEHLDRIVIKDSKKKLIGLLAGSLIFVAIGILMFLYPDAVDRFPPTFNKVIGGVCVLFFGLGVVAFFKNISNKNLNVILDEKGITDNISFPKAGTIEWKDIEHFSIQKIASVNMLLIFVSDPQKYINRANQRGMKNNLALCGTPFAIPSSILSCSLKELEDWINTKLKQYHPNASK